MADGKARCGLPVNSGIPGLLVRISQHHNVVVSLGSVLNYLIYFSFFFPGFLVGPYLDYASYIGLINETLFTTKKGKEKEIPAGGRRVPKGRKRVGYTKMAIGLGFLGMYVTLIGSFNFEVVLQEWFVKKSLFYRYVQQFGPERAFRDLLFQKNCLLPALWFL